MGIRFRRCGVCVLVTFVLIGNVANATIYMKVDNITGDSKDQLHMGWSEVLSFQLQFHSNCTNAAGGASCPPSSMSTRFGMTVDSGYTPMLLRELAQTLNNTITVEAYSGTTRIDRYEFMGVRFGDFTVTYGTSPPGQLVGFLLTPQHFKELHYLYDPNTGQPLGPQTTMWDFAAVAAQAAAPIPGDYDVDGDVDGDDYQVWRGEYGFLKGTIGTCADGNADGIVDAADYVVWRDNLWTPVLASSVPEPVTILMVVMGGAVVGGAILPRKRRNVGRWLLAK